MMSVGTEFKRQQQQNFKKSGFLTSLGGQD